MNKENLIQLTQNLYRLTLLFPKKEPLRYKMRELADEIFAKSINNQHPVLIKDLEVLDGYFEVAKSQNWVSPKEILNLQEEYSRLKNELGRFSPVRPGSVLSAVRPVQNEISSSSDRHQKILEFLRENGRVQVWQIKKIFPEVSKRTLRRDFEFLLKQGKIERIGERNETFYRLRS
jgi:hypothetical protein